MPGSWPKLGVLLSRVPEIPDWRTLLLGPLDCGYEGDDESELQVFVQTPTGETYTLTVNKPALCRPRPRVSRPRVEPARG